MKEHQARIQDLRRRLSLALLLPVALLLTIGALLALAMQRLVDDAEWVDHTDAVLTRSSEIQRDLVEVEAAVRGFLLTGDDRFLEHYELARPAQAIEELRAVMDYDAGQTARVDTIARRYAYWKEGAVDAALQDPTLARTRDQLLEGKRRMDSVREAIDAFRQVELDHRHERAATSATSLTAGRLVFVGLFVLAAATLAFLSRRQLASIASAYDEILLRDRAARHALEAEQWVRAGQAKLSRVLLGNRTLERLAFVVLETLAEYVEADVGAFFVVESGTCTRLALFGLDPSTAGPSTFEVGQAAVGRAAERREPLHLRGDAPREGMAVITGTSQRTPVDVVIFPAIYGDTTHAVIELGFLRPADERALSLVSRVGEAIALAVRAEHNRDRMRELLEASQRQGEVLQTQREELQRANEELEQHSASLREAQQKLEERQQLIEQVNARLQDNALELVQSREAFRQKTDEAHRASAYKSEFLANMSHELRTPLNSTLILAKLLADNKEGNLTEEQARFGSTIYAAGNDLLALINDVLDLSKIEAGRVDVNIAKTSLARLLAGLSRTFEPVAKQKNLAFSIVKDPSVPDEIETDAQRLEQIVRNLVSNALKFTKKGAVSVRVRTGEGATIFEVTDTGVGIAPEQHQMIFEPFRQADGTTNRKYGGTGLGLSISRELATLLGGALEVESKLNKGSTFRLTLPPYQMPLEPGELRPSTLPETPRIGGPKAVTTAAAFGDDRDLLDPDRTLFLVIEDDVAFARILFDLAHERGLQCVVAHDAEAGLALAHELSPSAIVLDISLPDHSGLYVLDRLKHSPQTRHVPVYVMTVTEHAHEALSMGAVGYLRKPIDRDALADAITALDERASKRARHLLVIEGDEARRDELVQQLASDDVSIVGVASDTEAVSALASTSFDCIVTDFGLEGGRRLDRLDRLAREGPQPLPPVVAYTGKPFTRDEEQRLRKHSRSRIVKGARSLARLFDEVSLFLHQVEGQLPAATQEMLKEARSREVAFEGKTILVVEDDVRNVFALTKILEPKGAAVAIARNGREALDALDRGPIDLVLMDVMMPEMDGLEATRAVRQRADWAALPVIALTAKAMPDDREMCLRAGANDYVAKPIDVDMLLSLVRVWMTPD